MKNQKLNLIGAAILSFFWVIFLWNFWDKGIFALGLNAAIFLFSLLALFIFNLYQKTSYTKQDLFWLLPIILIITSFTLYENPFLKTVNLLVLPILFAVFYNQAFLSNKKTIHWNFKFILLIIERFFSFFKKIGEASIAYVNLIIPNEKTKKQTTAKIIGGIFLFLLLALTVFIPLLSSADALFASKVQFIYDLFLNVVSLPVVYKILTFIALAIFFVSVLIAWSKNFVYQEEGSVEKKIDPIIPGIILSGVLLLYLLFLWIQLSRLWVGTLPFDFKETEGLVKSGFWQLFFLSIINILIYFFTYRKTTAWVQKLLTIFTFASLFLLISAAYRMGLYVIYYGLSYEKFFASYTVVFCTVIFIWLIIQLFIKKRANILKFLVFLFLWMYALLTVLPIEQFILRGNVALSKSAESRINLPELTMLSPDVLSLVKKYQKQGILDKQEFNWQPWLERQEKILLEKNWYEVNLSNLFNY